MNNKEHGEFRLWAGKNILYAQISGAWNELTALRFCQEFKALAEKTMPAQWGHLVYLDDWVLGVPAIEPLIQELVEWSMLRGLRRSAQVFSPSMMKQYQLDKMVVEQCGEFIRQQFIDKSQAAHWLEQQGFSVEPELATFGVKSLNS